MLSANKEMASKEQDETVSESSGRDPKVHSSRTRGKHRRRHGDKTSSTPMAKAEPEVLASPVLISPVDLDISKPLSEKSGRSGNSKFRNRRSKSKTPKDEVQKTRKHRKKITATHPSTSTLSASGATTIISDVLDTPQIPTLPHTNADFSGVTSATKSRERGERRHKSRSKKHSKGSVSKESKHKSSKRREKTTVTVTSGAEQPNIIQGSISFPTDVSSSSSMRSSGIPLVLSGARDSEEDTSDEPSFDILSPSSSVTKANSGLLTVGPSFFSSSSSSSPVIFSGVERRELRNPSYTEYVFMAHLAYLQEEQGAEDLREEDVRQVLSASKVLTRLAKRTLGIEASGDERWQMISCPDGSFVSGYVGAIFIHTQRQQIVVAHAGTLPGRRKTLVADLQGIVLKDQNPLVLDAIMQSQDLMRTRGLGVDLQSLVQQGYHLSFTGHSLGGFLAEMSVFACHRGFGFHYPAANAVVFDSPGSGEVIEVWQSNLPLQRIDVKQLNIVSFLSSPNIVNTLHSHPGIVYRLMRPIETSTFSSYLMNSHSRVKMATLFEVETGIPRQDTWVEMDSWPLASYEELLSLADKPLEAINIIARNALELVLALPTVVVDALKRRTKGISIQRIIGGGQVANWWRQVGVEAPRDYHIYFDTSTSIGLKHAQETGYSIKVRGALAVGNFLPLINIKPATLRFLITHQDYRTRAHYVPYIEARRLPPLHELPLYEINREHNVIYMMDQHSHHSLFSLIDNVETMLMRHQELFDLERSYLHYVEHAIEQAMQAIEHTASENTREAFAQAVQLRTEMLSLIEQASTRLSQQTPGLAREIHLRGAVATVSNTFALKLLSGKDFQPLTEDELKTLRAQLQPGGKLYISSAVTEKEYAPAICMDQETPVDPTVTAFATAMTTALVQRGIAATLSSPASSSSNTSNQDEVLEAGRDKHLRRPF